MLKEEKTFSSGDLKVVWVQGTGITSMAHLTKIQEAVDKLELLVVAEPFINEIAILSGRKDGIYILPVATQFENEGIAVSTNRSAQWGFFSGPQKWKMTFRQYWPAGCTRQKKHRFLQTSSSVDRKSVV